MAGPTPDNGVRRSKRTRVQTLAWYRSERISYRWDKEAHGMCYVIVVIVVVVPVVVVVVVQVLVVVVAL